MKEISEAHLRAAKLAKSKLKGFMRAQSKIPLKKNKVK